MYVISILQSIFTDLFRSVMLLEVLKLVVFWAWEKKTLEAFMQCSCAFGARNTGIKSKTAKRKKKKVYRLMMCFHIWEHLTPWQLQYTEYKTKMWVCVNNRYFDSRKKTPAVTSLTVTHKWVAMACAASACGTDCSLCCFPLIHDVTKWSMWRE